MAFDILDSMTNAQMNAERNCINCANYSTCVDPKKRIGYECNRFKPVEFYGIGGKGKVTKKSTAGLSLLNDGKIIVPDNAALRAQIVLADMDSDDKRFEFKLMRNVMDVVMSEDKTLSRDMKVPDGDFPLAPNFYTFCTNDRYLKGTPYPWQVLLPTIFFAEFCPRCTDMDYLMDNWQATDSFNKIERKVAFLEHGVCPHCKAKRSDMVRDDEMYFYEEAALCLGQRSGKSANLGDVAAYQTHHMIKLQNVNEVYRLKANNELHGTFCALTYGQAKDTLWDPFFNNLMDGPWFQSYHAMLTEVGAKHGEELFKLKDSFVQYRHRKIKVYPAGPDKRVLRGRTRFFAAIDELGWFPNGADAVKLVKLNADEVYKALSNSLRTVRAAANLLMRKGFDNIPTAFFVNLSSPSSVRDKIMELVRKSQDSKKIFGIQLATWYANPNMPRSEFEEEFSRDPVGSMRDFGAQPPIANSPLISNVDNIMDRASTKVPNPIKIKHEINTSSNGNKTRYARVLSIREGQKPSVLAIDAGYSNNAFAIAVGHKFDSKRVKLDMILEVQPLPGVPLNYTRIFSELVSPIIEARNVQIIAADRWNSIKLLQDAEAEHDIQAVQYSLKYIDMVFFKDFMEANGQMQYPKPSLTMDEVLAYDQSKYPQCFEKMPIEHFMLQCATVQDTGATVLKGDQLNDDMVRASMLCTQILMDEKYAEILDAAGDAPKNQVNVANSIIMRGGGGTGRTSNTSFKSASGRPIGVSKSRVF